MAKLNQGFIQRGGGGGGGETGISPPKVQLSPPKNLRKIYYYRKISTMMINTNYVTVHDRNEVYRLIHLLFSLNTSRTSSKSTNFISGPSIAIRLRVLALRK